MVAASWIDLDGGSYSFIDGLTPGSASATITADGAHYTGFPPELSCPGGPE